MGGIAGSQGSSSGASWSQGINEAISQSMGMSQSSGMSQQASAGMSQQQGRTFLDPNQQRHQAQMLDTAARFVNPQQTQQRATDMTNQFMPGMRESLNHLGTLSDPTQQIATQTGALQQGLGQIFRNEMMPAIRSDALASGGFGGGRQGVAEGVAAGRIADAFTAGHADITGRANQQAAAAAQARAQLTPEAINMGMMPMTSAFGPLAQFANLLGDPTVLSQTSGFSQDRSSGISQQQATAFDQALSRAYGLSESGSKSDSKSTSFGLSIN